MELLLLIAQSGAVNTEPGTTRQEGGDQYRNAQASNRESGSNT